MNFAAILAGLVKFANLVMDFFSRKQLMDVGKNEARAEYTEDQNAKLQAAMRARVDADDPSVLDPHDRANRS